MKDDYHVESRRLTMTSLRELPSEKKLIPKLRSVNVEDLPSNISVDEWGEVVKYSKILDY